MPLDIVREATGVLTQVRISHLTTAKQASLFFLASVTRLSKPWVLTLLPLSVSHTPSSLTAGQALDRYVASINSQRVDPNAIWQFYEVCIGSFSLLFAVCCVNKSCLLRKARSCNSHVHWSILSSLTCAQVFETPPVERQLADDEIVLEAKVGPFLLGFPARALHDAGSSAFLKRLSPCLTSSLWMHHLF